MHLAVVKQILHTVLIILKEYLYYMVTCNVLYIRTLPFMLSLCSSPLKITQYSQHWAFQRRRWWRPFKCSWWAVDTFYALNNLPHHTCLHAYTVIAIRIGFVTHWHTQFACVIVYNYTIALCLCHHWIDSLATMHRSCISLQCSALQCAFTPGVNNW